MGQFRLDLQAMYARIGAGGVPRVYNVVVDRLVRAATAPRIAPAPTILDHEHDGADNPPVVDARGLMRMRKLAGDAPHLRLGQQKQISHDEATSPRL